MTSSLFRRRLGIRAGYEMLRHRQLRMDRLNVSVSIQADDGGMYTHVLLSWYICTIANVIKKDNNSKQTKLCQYLFLHIFVGFRLSWTLTIPFKK